MFRARLLSLLPAATAAILVAACGSIGDGVAPRDITFEPAFVGTTLQQQKARLSFEEDGVFRVAECIPAAANLVLTLDNGARENITRRSRNVRYSSSNEAVLRVSNNDIPFRGSETQFYPRGALLPVAPGTATISVEFVGLTAEVDVEVLPLDGFETFVDFPPAMAPNSFAEIRATGVFDGQTLGASAAFRMSLSNASGDDSLSYATIEEGGDGQSRFVRAVAPGGPAQTLQIEFDQCDKTLMNNEFEFRVESPQSLRIEREFGDGNPVPVGFSDLLTATAVFNDGAEQDLTSQMRFRRVEDSDPVSLLVNVSGISNALFFGLALPANDDEDAENGNGGGGNGSPSDGGIAEIAATYDQFNQTVANRVPEERRPPNLNVESLPPLEADILPVEVRRGRATDVRWDIGTTDSDGTRLLELPRGCGVQPDVIADIEAFDADGGIITFSRRINRVTSFFVGPEPPPDENGDESENGENGGNGEGSANEEDEPAPILQVVNRQDFASNLAAGTIFAIGDIGDEEIVRAVRVSPEVLQTGDQTEIGTITLEDVLRVRIVDEVDCATLL